MEGVLSDVGSYYPGQACGAALFSEEAAHLLPSRWEPCGLVALHGLRYGAVSIVTATGGLDVVTPEACSAASLPACVLILHAALS